MFGHHFEDTVNQQSGKNNYELNLLRQTSALVKCTPTSNKHNITGVIL